MRKSRFSRSFKTDGNPSIQKSLPNKQRITNKSDFESQPSIARAEDPELLQA